MGPGDIVIVDGTNYTVEKEIEGGECSEIFVAKDPSGGRFVLKFMRKKPTPNSRGKVNHYGSARDASEVVFEEIKGSGACHRFLIRFVARQKITGRWVLVTEYVAGEPLDCYLDNNLSDSPKVTAACRLLGATLAQWHRAKFAHGDPHLNNAVVEEREGSPAQIKLVDLNMIHHPCFRYCERLGCFASSRADSRYSEDLRNWDTRIGNGFLKEICSRYGTHPNGRAMILAFKDGYLTGWAE